VLALSGAVFMIVSLVTGNLLPAVPMDDPATAVFTLAERHLGPVMLVMTAIVLVWVSGFTNALPMQAGVSRVLFAMARDGQLPAPLARLHAERGTPHVAMLLSSTISLVVGALMLNNVEMLTQIVNFGALAAFGFLHLAVLRTTGAASVTPGQRLFQWGFATAGLLLTLVIISQLHAMALGVGLAWLLAGGALAARVKP
jgi:amino acid transporter